MSVASSPQSGASERDNQLDSWKEIAAYLKRGVRTVQHWEHEAGLPVRRLATKKRGAVYAYKTEIDAWREQRSSLLAGESEEIRPPEPIIGVLCYGKGSRSQSLLLYASPFQYFSFGPRPSE